MCGYHADAVGGDTGHICHDLVLGASIMGGFVRIRRTPGMSVGRRNPM